MDRFSTRVGTYRVADLSDRARAALTSPDPYGPITVDPATAQQLVRMGLASLDDADASTAYLTSDGRFLGEVLA